MIGNSNYLEEADEEYEPTEEGTNLQINSILEILEYAKFLGMDIVRDQDLLYIAEEGVTALFLNISVKSTCTRAMESTSKQ